MAYKLIANPIDKFPRGIQMSGRVFILCVGHSQSLLNGIIYLLISVLRYSTATRTQNPIGDVYTIARACMREYSYRYARLTYSAVTHSNYARFGRDLTPLFAINFGVLSEAVRAPHGPPKEPRNFKIHQARLEFYDRSSQYRIAPGINNSISKPEKTFACSSLSTTSSFLVSPLFHTTSCHLFIRYVPSRVP